MKLRIYIDTSVVGGYFDEEFKEATIALFNRLENREVIRRRLQTHWVGNNKQSGCFSELEF